MNTTDICKYFRPTINCTPSQGYATSQQPGAPQLQKNAGDITGYEHWCLGLLSFDRADGGGMCLVLDQPAAALLEQRAADF